jgi:hypothetical protein
MGAAEVEAVVGLTGEPREVRLVPVIANVALWCCMSWASETPNVFEFGFWPEIAACAASVALVMGSSDIEADRGTAPAAVMS